ncbi:MAG: UPF0236 family protein, partial [Dehalococcoidales bacterium]|nr:UPF0236 family protein [Dehalococcoidales bacterium]
FLETGELPESEGKKVTNLVTEGDGVMLSLQREKTRRAEVKVGIAYEGWEQIGKERYQTLNKSIYGDIACSEEYWAGMTLKLYQKYDMAAPERVVLGGDGAEWVKEGLNWVGGRFQLDRYHLNRELRTALGPDNETIKLVRQACSEGDVGKACQLLSEAEKKTRGDQAKKIEKARHYLMKNESGLRDYRLDLGEEAKGLRRTGAMEGNVDKLVVKRMKGHGMSWTIKGCRRMLWVRFHWLEGTLKESLGPPIQTVLPIGRTTGLMTRKVKHIIDKTLTENPGNWLNMKLPALYGPHCSRPWALVLKSLAQGKI